MKKQRLWVLWSLGLYTNYHRLNVARLAGLPEGILEAAKAKSKEKEEETTGKEKELVPIKQAKFIESIMKNAGSIAYSDLIDIMETL